MTQRQKYEESSRSTVGESWSGYGLVMLTYGSEYGGVVLGIHGLMNGNISEILLGLPMYSLGRFSSSFLLPRMKEIYLNRRLNRLNRDREQNPEK